MTAGDAATGGDAGTADGDAGAGALALGLAGSELGAVAVAIGPGVGETTTVGPQAAAKLATTANTAQFSLRRLKAAPAA
jgi:hypothetical protein